jgi:ferredoxin-NADP reductase/predicted pyridoxine 5'-phosphate oxidase superfamily flavin-nucleotide-binding protein
VTTDNPFHAGELEAHRRTGVGDVAQWAGGFIRDHLPKQHRDFHAALPFLVVSGADDAGRTWVTLLDGDEGFIRAPDPYTLMLDAYIDPQDPLTAAFSTGTDVGAVGIDLATRRRNRFNGKIRPHGNGYAIDMSQTFGNCSQYIHERTWTRVPHNMPAPAISGAQLSPSQTALIAKADTMFIGSGHSQGSNVASRGFDASHRGGAPGFVHVSDATHLHIPDYAGNNFFNTIGNLITDPRVGLVFVDFATGSLLHISGRATIDWEPENAHDHDAWRMINVEIDAVIERPNAVSLRWAKQDDLSQQLNITRRVKEARDITSFYLSRVDGKPVKPFEAGQHLPITVQIPGQVGTSKRSYTLSGAPDAAGEYRLSIKRESQGLVSRFLHDAMPEGSLIEASIPAGDFIIPTGNQALVFVSAGVGITPMISMLHDVAAAGAIRPIWFIHGARNGQDHAMQDEVNALMLALSSAQQRVFYSQPETGDTYDVAGRIDADAVLNLGAGPDAQYMLCGPARFVSEIKTDLEAAGVPASHIHFETFGPTAVEPSKDTAQT